MTTNLIDIQNTDVIMITSNMAENHPVGFQWVMKAKERGAKVIHVDPRFTRTSAAADIHVPLRSGTNIAFFGALMSYAMQKNLFFKDYVVHYTNASFLIDPAFKTPTDLAGLFTGYDEARRVYDRSSWKYQLDGEGNPRRDLTLRDPNSVFQLLRDINAGGTVVVMATHDREMVDKMRKRVIALDNGDVIRDERRGQYTTD